MSKENIVITLKLKTGEDLLGWYAGDSVESDIEKSVLLYKPIKIKQIYYNTKQGSVFSYASDLYSLFGSAIVTIPYSNISLRDIASEFFSLYYQRTLGDILVVEENIRRSYIKFYDAQDVKDAMKDSDSFYLDTISEYKQ